MEKNKIVSKLINKKLNLSNEKELLDMLFEENTINIDKNLNSNLTFGDKVADLFTKIVGSWKFIISFSLFLISWILLNLFYIKNFDPYPFILLNLLLSCIASLQAPIIMMSQNKEAKKDSLRSLNDYKIDLKSELILEDLHDKLELIIQNQNKILKNRNL